MYYARCSDWRHTDSLHSRDHLALLSTLIHSTLATKLSIPSGDYELVEIDGETLAVKSQYIEDTLHDAVRFMATAL